VEIDWTTFALETLNFLVLVWILQRFLYRPVTEAVERRRQAISESLAAAKAAEERAKGLQLDYEGRLAAFASEKQEAQRRLGEEMVAERARQMQALQSSLAEEHERQRVLALRELAADGRRRAREAQAQGAHFVAGLLERLADRALETRILAVLIEDLARLDPEAIESIREAAGQPDATYSITSAYPLAGPERQALADALADLCGIRLPSDFIEDRALLAGFRIAIGPWVLRANLKDELSFFAEADRDGH
jgi:F-type H+-transporting ATPase subunit b